MKRMKTILAVAGLIWVMSHGFPIFEGSKFVVHWIKSLMIIM